MSNSGKLGLYLHVPFCRHKCLYCDFCSFPHPTRERMEAYAARLCEDLLQTSAGECVDTVYFGGGTPTLLPTPALIQILETVARVYSVDPQAEITLECNPNTVGAEDLFALRRAGFNRISLGMQSAHAEELRRLGRGHTLEELCSTFHAARKAGFENISLDVMSGIPAQTVESYLQTLNAAVALSPEHLSAYGLTVEEGTGFDRLRQRGALILPDEEETRRMYFAGAEYLESQGYLQYEISNFARTGYESRHNLKYWCCEEYLGFGPAAYSDYRGERFGNSRSLDDYLAGHPILCERETPDAAERENEYVMLRMRLCAGVSEREFDARFGEGHFSRFAERLSRYLSMGLVCHSGDRFAFTREGMYVSNAILSEILEF